MAPNTMKSEWGLCVVGESTPEDDAHQVYSTFVRPSLASRTKDGSSIPLYSRFFYDTRVAVELVQYNLAARCGNGRYLVKF